MVLLSAIFTALVPIGMFYVAYVSKTDYFLGFLKPAFDRAFIPSIVLMVVLAVMSSNSLFISDLPDDEVIE